MRDPETVPGVVKVGMPAADRSPVPTVNPVEPTHGPLVISSSAPSTPLRHTSSEPTMVPAADRPGYNSMLGGTMWIYVRHT